MKNGVVSLKNKSMSRVHPLRTALTLLLPLVCTGALAQTTAPAPQRWQFQISPSAMPRYEPTLAAPTQRSAITGWAFNSQRSALGLSFDEMIEGITVFEGSLRVWTLDGEAVPGRFYTQENLVNFVPDAPWAEETTYVVELPAGGVADVSGNRVAETKRWTFTTGLELETPRW